MDTDVPSILLPCAICARTFAPQSLEKHIKICQRTVIKKRKPFDSAKQRIQGTELEEFLPKQENKRPHQEERIGKSTTSWKQTHDEFLRAIRAARREPIEVPNKQTPNHVTTGAPTRANEKGTCPTCNRQFGIKAYDRHVAWCRERCTRVQLSPATNLAKERLEARIRYRAPALKNRKPTIREKYMPGSATNLGYAAKSSLLPANAMKVRESVSLPNCNKGNDSAAKQKPAARKVGQSRESSIPTGPIKSRPMDRVSGSNKIYDPYLMAEQQMRDLLSDTSDISSTDGTSTQQNSAPKENPTQYPLAPSSAFVKYPPQTLPTPIDSSKKRVSLLAPPSEFDDLTSDFSSDCTETNSISCEHSVNDLISQTRDALDNSPNKEKSPSREHILGRRVIIDKSKALGSDIEASSRGRSLAGSVEKTRKVLEKVSCPKIIRPMVNRSHSVRSASAPKIPERKSSSSSESSGSQKKCMKNSKISDLSPADRSNNNHSNNNSSSYSSTMNGSNLSLNSIVSSDVDIKRSNSMFDELMSSFDEDSSTILPSLRSLLKSDPLSMSSPIQSNHKRNGQVSDDDLSSPDSYKRQDHSKLSADSAYSSLNRKYYNHGRSTNDMASRLNEDPTSKCREGDSRFLSKCKMSKFCHECGSKFPDSAKFCCECGVKRLAL